jgi:hypothetical protein
MADAPVVPLRRLTPGDFARFGTGDIAYFRAVLVNGEPAVAIFAADGTPIGGAPNESLAIAAIIQHEMAPARVH